MFATTLLSAIVVWQSDPLLLSEPFEHRPSILCLALDAAAAKGDRKALRETLASNPQLFAYLNQLRITEPTRIVPKELVRALDAEIGKRVSHGAPRWKADSRLDFLVEGAVLTRNADEYAARESVGFAASIVRKVVADRKTTLISRNKLDLQPGEEQLKSLFESLEKRIDLMAIATDLEPQNSGHPIGLFDKVVVNCFERYGIVCVRDGLDYKSHKLDRCMTVLDRCIVLSNGTVGLDQCRGTVVICDGVIRFDRFLVDSGLFISNESIISGEGLNAKSTFIARNKIKALVPTSTKGSTLIAGDEIDVLKPKGGEFGTHIVGKDKCDSGVRFFAVADVGLELKEVDGKAIVKSVAEDSPFRKSLKPGDRINSINDKFFKDFDDCRRVLREACVVGYAFVNRTRDGGHARVLVDLLGYPKPLKAK